MSRFFILIIQIYRQGISPILHVIVPIKSGCRLYPTCSEYSIEAIRTHGVVAGTRKGLIRLASCYPFIRHSHL